MRGLSFVPPLFSGHLVHRSPMTCTAMSSVRKQRPVLVADVMDTLVLDPFFNGMQSYFGFQSFAEFLGAKTPGLWVQFEKGLVDEEKVGQNFFKDGRSIDVADFKRFLKRSYSFLPGVEHMLQVLHEASVDVHLCTNYPVWAALVEDTLQLRSRFGAHWTFVSGEEGVRKPAKEAYLKVAEKANVDPSSCVLLDDRARNCDGAIAAGYKAAILFQNAEQASEELRAIFVREGVSLDF